MSEPDPTAAPYLDVTPDEWVRAAQDVRDQGYAAAIGIVLLLIAVAFTVIRWRTSRTRDLTE